MSLQFTNLEELKALILKGEVSLEDMKELRSAVRPRSEKSVEREAAETSLAAFLAATISDIYDVPADVTIEQVFKDITTLQNEIKKHGGTRVKHSTHTLKWADKERLVVTTPKNNTLYCADSDNDKDNREVFIADGYTIGQWNAVTKYRRSLTAA